MSSTPSVLRTGEPWPGQDTEGWGTGGTGDTGWEEGWWTTAGVVSWSTKGMILYSALFFSEDGAVLLPSQTNLLPQGLCISLDFPRHQHNSLLHLL